MREIKFRAWHLIKSMFIPNGFSIDMVGMYLTDARDNIYHIGDDVVVMKYTCFKCKEGNELYEKDLVRVRYEMGDQKQYFTDSVYEVSISPLYGIELNFRCLYKDSEVENNQHPISTTLSSRYNNLDTDSRNSNYDKLAVQDTFGENHMMRTSWKENWYSNSIEKIGNKYEHSHLLNT